MHVESFCEEIVGYFAGLFEAVNAFVYFEVYSSMVGKCTEIIFIEEFLWYDHELDVDILRLIWTWIGHC